MGALTGFVNAPVAKGSCLLVLGASVLSASLKAAKRLDLHMPSVLRGEVWRLITSQLAFEETGQTLSGLILLYSFRQFERQMGSRKFGSFLVVTTAIAATFEMVAALIFNVTPSAGPFGAIYSMFVLYYASVPKLHPRLMGFLGVDLSDKSFYYILGLQLLLSSNWESVIPATCGLLAGALWRSDALPLQRLKLPIMLCRCFSWLGPLLNTRPSRRRPAGQRQNGAGGMPGREQLIPGWGRGQPRNQAAGGLRQPLVEPPSEDAIRTLMGLGFERTAVIRALQASGNNVEVAANRLLTGGS